jgi:PTS system ascorbate-specific IIA component
MGVGLLILTHDDIGAVLLRTVSQTLGTYPLRVETLTASKDCNPDSLLGKARSMMAALDEGGGVLVLTDLYGSTPSNIAAKLLADEQVRVVTGLNLPMLIKLFNYPQLNLDALVDKALIGGREGIFASAPDRT